MRVALVYDRVNKWGGAERLLQVLHQIWPEAPLFTSVYDSKGAPWAKDFDVRTSFLQQIPLVKRKHEAFGWLTPLAFESLDLPEFEVVISVTSEAAKGVITSPRQLHLCYLLTPTRYLWSHKNEYLGSLPRVFRPLASTVQSCLRVWDFMAAQRPDHLISISEQVRKRCEKYYRRESEVVYPPLALTQPAPAFQKVQKVQKVQKGQSLKGQSFFLVVSRLVRYKRIELAIKACNQLKTPLAIVGTGSDEKRLRQLAGPTVKFVGHLTDKELVRYYQGARALLLAQEEDLGLVALEAQAFGLPVISYRSSGAAELIIDGKTGILFNEQTVNSLIAAIKQLEVCDTSIQKYRQQVERFSKEKFVKKFKTRVEDLWLKHQKNICL